MKSMPFARYTLALSALGLALAGCGTTFNPSAGTLTAQDKTLVSEAAVADVASMLGEANFADATGASFALNSLAFGTLAWPAGCRIVSGDATDLDGDHVPTDAIYTFSLQACARHYANGTGAHSVSGIKEISDPTPNIADHSWSEKLTGWVNLDSRPDGVVVKETRDGDRRSSISGSVLIKQHDVTVLRVRTGAADTTWHNTGSFTFTAAKNAVISDVDALPAGTIALNGMREWTRNGKSVTFTASTLTPLIYDPTCVSNDLRQIVGGELDYTSPKGTVKIVYGACNVDPTVTFEPPTPTPVS